MITLRNKLYESLLDDEEELIADDSAIIINDLTSDFYKDYHNRRFVKDIAKIKDGAVQFTDELFLNYEGKPDHKSISYYLPGINTLKTDGKLHIIPLRGMKVFDDKYICKNMSAESFYFDLRGVERIENINLFVDDEYSSRPRYKVTFYDPMDKLSLLKNIKIDTNQPWLLVNFQTSKMPKFDNVTFNGKTTRLKIYDINLTDKNDEITKIINSVLDLTYKSQIMDAKKNELIERKSDLKTIQAIIHNSKRYDLKSELFKLKPNTKIKDIFGQLPNGIEFISISNNICEIVFEYDPQGIIKQRLNDISQPLSDGWSMRIIDK